MGIHRGLGGGRFSTGEGQSISLTDVEVELTFHRRIAEVEHLAFSATDQDRNPIGHHDPSFKAVSSRCEIAEGDCFPIIGVQHLRHNPTQVRRLSKLDGRVDPVGAVAENRIRPIGDDSSGGEHTGAGTQHHRFARLILEDGTQRSRTIAPGSRLTDQ